jgi:hypothetical protein
MSLQGIESSVVQPVAIPTELSRFIVTNNNNNNNIIIIIIIIIINKAKLKKKLLFDPIIKHELLLRAGM